MKRKVWFYIGFFVVLLAGFYAALMATTDFGKVKLPILNNIHPFEFTRQDGKTVSERDVNGKVYVAEYFFTSCKGICPKMNRNMKRVYESLKQEKDFVVLSHTVDPQTDSVQRLRTYADSIGADAGNWWFLTGTKESLYKTARESYLLDDPQNNTLNVNEQFLHTQFFALVDRKGQLRGIYDGLKEEEIQKLMKDCRKMLDE
jgi:protein SCO1/2